MEPYKIFTYADPFKLTEADFWGEIKGYPHLCSSRALVTGLGSLYGRDFVPCLCTIEDVTERVYPRWVNGIELQIEQLVYLSEAIDVLPLGDKMKQTLKFNKKELIKAVRFLQEMNIDASDMELRELSELERGLVALYKYLLEQHRKSFVMQESCTIRGYRDALLDFLKYETVERAKIISGKKDLLKSLKKSAPPDFDLRKYKRALKKQEQILEGIHNTESEWGGDFSPEKDFLKKVVFHGLHLFNPLRVRLIQELARQGTEIIFLHNYLPDYPGIYSTWDKVYSWNDVLPRRDEVNVTYQGDPLGCEDKEPSFGKAAAGLLTGDFSSKFSSKNELSPDFYEFANNTSFAYHAGDIYEESKLENPDLYQMEKYHGGKMKEYIYSANYRPVNDIIRMYYPELYGSRHFLSYPVGQFILSLYRMWDEETNDLLVEPRLLKECFNTSLFIKEPVQMSSLYHKTELFFQDIRAGSDYPGRIDTLTANLDFINGEGKEAGRFRENGGNAGALDKVGGLDNYREDLKGFSFYSVTKDELLVFKENIIRLKDLAESLFGKQADEKVDFKKHFEKLINLIRAEGEENDALNERERELIDGLIERFDNLERLEISGSLEDIKESIHYYLKQKESGEEADYLVGNFEQIEGGVLLSEVAGKDKRYHFAGLSENNMKADTRGRFPWPLSESFFVNGFNNENLTLKIVLESMREYRNFLRYAFFFGVFFVRRPFSLSFTRNENDSEQEPWFLLDLLGLKSKNYEESGTAAGSRPLAVQTPVTGDASVNSISEANAGSISKTNVPSKDFEFEKNDCQTYAFCPRRYLFDRLLGGGSPYYNEFFCSQYYRIILYERVWQKLSGEKLRPYLLTETLAETEEELRKFFPFWKTHVDFADNRKRVMDDMIADFDEPNNRFREYNTDSRNYLEIRKNFIYAMIKSSENNDNKLKELHRLRRDKPDNPSRKKTGAELLNLLTEGGIPEFNVDERCEICKEREVCLQSYKT